MTAEADDVVPSPPSDGEAEVVPTFMFGVQIAIEDLEMMEAVRIAAGLPYAAPSDAPPTGILLELQVKSTRSMMDLRRIIRTIAPHLEYMGCTHVSVCIVERTRPDLVESRYQVPIGKIVDALEPPPRQNTVPSPTA